MAPRAPARAGLGDRELAPERQADRRDPRAPRPRGRRARRHAFVESARAPRGRARAAGSRALRPGRGRARAAARRRARAPDRPCARDRISLPARRSGNRPSPEPGARLRSGSSQRRLVVAGQAPRSRQRTSTLAAVAFAAAALIVFVGLAFVAGYIIGKLL